MRGTFLSREVKIGKQRLNKNRRFYGVLEVRSHVLWQRSFVVNFREGCNCELCGDSVWSFYVQEVLRAVNFDFLPPCDIVACVALKSCSLSSVRQAGARTGKMAGRKVCRNRDLHGGACTGDIVAHSDWQICTTLKLYSRI